MFLIRHGKGDQAAIAKVPVRLLEEYRAALGEETVPVFVALRKESHLRNATRRGRLYGWMAKASKA